MKRKTLALLLSAMLAAQPSSVVLAEDLLSSGNESAETVPETTEPQAAALTDRFSGGNFEEEMTAGEKTNSPQRKTEETLLLGIDVTGTLDSNGLLVIKGTGEMLSNPLMSYEVDGTIKREQIKEVRVEKGVTNIGEFTFQNCSKLTSITLPEGITSIGACAFGNCSSLESITFPEEVTSIGAYAFEGCSKLTGITLPKRTTNIGVSAFKGCSKLTGITLPEGITSIGQSVFEGCGSLESITLPESVTSIGINAFKDCSKLTGIALPKRVTSIEQSVFEGCGGLESITLLEGVTHIRTNAFKNCGSLKSIILPEGVTHIEEGAFSGCSSLTSITLPKSLQAIGNTAFSPNLAYTVYIGTAGERHVQNVGASKVIRLCNEKHNLEEETVLQATFAKNGTMKEVCTNQEENVDGKFVQCQYGGTEKTIPQVSEILTYAAENAYTGQRIEPEVTVKDVEENKLTEGMDYTVTYPKECTNVGENYKFTVTLTGKYNGETAGTYKIVKANPAAPRCSGMGRKYNNFYYTERNRRYRIWRSAVCLCDSRGNSRRNFCCCIGKSLA